MVRKVSLGLFGLLVAGLPLTAWSQPRPRIAANPLEVIGGLGNRNLELQRAYAEELGRRQVEVVDPARTAKLLAAQPDGHCHLEDSCYGRLAAEIGADATIVVTVAPYASTVIVNGRMVAPDGVVLGRAKRREIKNANPGSAPVERIQAEIRSVLAELNPETAIPIRPVPVREEGGGLPMVSTAAFIGSGALLAGSVVFGALALSDSNRLKAQLGPDGTRTSDNAAARDLQIRTRTENTVMYVLLGASVAAAGVGVAAWLWPKSSDGQPTSTFFLVPSSQGPGFVFAHRF